MPLPMISSPGLPETIRLQASSSRNRSRFSGRSSPILSSGVNARRNFAGSVRMPRFASSSCGRFRNTFVFRGAVSAPIRFNIHAASSVAAGSLPARPVKSSELYRMPPLPSRYSSSGE